MGRLRPVWQLDFIKTLTDKGIAFTEEEDNELVFLDQQQVAIHLVSLTDPGTPADFIALQTQQQQQNRYVVHLWEDIWQSRREQVLARIASILGLNKTLHGRKGKIISINQAQADEFLWQHHIQGSAKTKYKFGLMIGEELVGVALFSAARPMKSIGPDYRSYELVRFASQMGFTVTGGFSKLLKHFINLVQPNDLMSYADRDWSLGHAYDASGFKMVNTTEPLMMWLDLKDYSRKTMLRLPAALLDSLKPLDKTKQRQFLIENNYLPVFNTGNLKYILYL
ncbi:hypothetical protein AQ505_10370 [Pedobacter sp. PACM 27299]|uniref:hypothetical protein n=1 Tax=Pedobacter sp. PACM 27299 TaxID=1727164 RepID=UPI0007069863|nr:hypothetical protein [Pedobacter sp. PACM 27299]ALL05865.1 hypothetical protein AQ505_10370 [Pedobacter sp. PACM 27299]